MLSGSVMIHQFLHLSISGRCIRVMRPLYYCARSLILLRTFFSILSVCLIHRTLLTVYYCQHLSYTTLIKKFPEFIQKIQNTSFIHQKMILSLSKYSPSTATHLPALDPALETFLELCCRYSHQSCLRFFHYLLSAAKMRSL